LLHFSDYHPDLRYVVGSEANCGGSLCCRVFPYTNVSAPINTPASLFGNDQCDTPEALATSVFRAVPKVTGYEREDFSFVLYTGDLVSHDPFPPHNALEHFSGPQKPVCGTPLAKRPSLVLWFPSGGRALVRGRNRIAVVPPLT
jgi:hypothetical protein